jgi:hypothetical protein
MADKKELEKAIAVHSMWKANLRKAIDQRKLEVPVEKIRIDNECEFGKWLYGPSLAAADKASAHYKTVKDLHADFHRNTAHIAELALQGKKAEAEALMASNSAYIDLSARLTGAMIAWKKESK